MLPTVNFVFDHYDAIDANRTISDYESEGRTFESFRARQNRAMSDGAKAEV